MLEENKYITTRDIKKHLNGECKCNPCTCSSSSIKQSKEYVSLSAGEIKEGVIKPAMPLVEPTGFTYSFSRALERLKMGKTINRKGWNGKGMFLFYVPDMVLETTEDKKDLLGEKVKHLGYIAMKTVDGAVVPWLASQTDLLAEDWEIV